MNRNLNQLINQMQRMQRYIDQLLVDLANAKPAAVMYDFSFPEGGEGEEWKLDLEEASLAPRKPLSDWTGIKQIQLPPARMISDQQIESLLQALIELLQAFNLMSAFHTYVPVRKQYHAIREHWNQDVPFLKYSVYYLDYCDHNQKNCPLGGEYCQCAFLEDYLAESLELEEADFEDLDDDLDWENDPRYRRDPGWDDLDF
jgi:hypothetical protein